MNVEFKGSFLKDLKNIKDKNLLSRVQAAILMVEQAGTIQEVVNCTKLQGSNNYYRMRIGDFRIGLAVEDDVATFVRFLSRGDIYKHFP